MSYKHLFGAAAVLCSAAIFVHSFQSANAFSQGPSVSYAQNPVFSFGGTVSGSTVSVFAAPSDQKMIVTDLFLMMANNACSSTISITASSGNTLGSFKLHSNLHYDNDKAAQSQPSSVQHAFNSGLPIEVNETLDISESGSCGVAYTVSGYYAHP